MSQAIAYTQVRDIALTTGNDFLVGASPNGVDLQLIGDAEALAQAVNIALQSFAGEWFLNTDDGVPYWQSVFIKNPNPRDQFPQALELALAHVGQVLALGAARRAHG